MRNAYFRAERLHQRKYVRRSKIQPVFVEIFQSLGFVHVNCIWPVYAYDCMYKKSGTKNMSKIGGEFGGILVWEVRQY